MEIENCGDCPLKQSTDYGDDCNHPEWPPELDLQTERRGYGNTPAPAVCPLRKAPIIVQLKVA